MDEFTYHNLGFLAFLKESVRRAALGYWYGMKHCYNGLVWFLKYLWLPVCDVCDEKKPECLTLTEPCGWQKEQKVLRIIALAFFLGLLAMIYFRWFEK